MKQRATFLPGDLVVSTSSFISIWNEPGAVSNISDAKVARLKIDDLMIIIGGVKTTPANRGDPPFSEVPVFVSRMNKLGWINIVAIKHV
jgi:hypothetical protein